MTNQRHRAGQITVAMPGRKERIKYAGAVFGFGGRRKEKARAPVTVPFR